MFCSKINCARDSAFLKRVNIFNEVRNFTEKDDSPKLLCQLMRWLKETVTVNKAYPELRSEINILYNGRKALVVAKTKANKLYLVTWRFEKD